MGTIYIDAAGGSTTNSGSTNNAAADVTLTINAGEAFADATLLVDVNTGALTSIVTSGSTQSTIYFTNATNANTKIFWISACIFSKNHHSRYNPDRTDGGNQHRNHWWAVESSS